MYTIVQTTTVQAWRQGLDTAARLRVATRLQRAMLGNFGDHKPVGDGVFEMRLTFGPGYRLYYVTQGQIVIVMLAGGDKSSQKDDIKRAKKLAKEL